METDLRKWMRLVESEQSARVRRIDKLRAELDDKRMKKSLAYDTHAKNLLAWIEHIDQMSDEDYEADRQRWMNDETPASGIHLAGREHHPADVLSGAWGKTKEVKRAMKQRDRS